MEAKIRELYPLTYFQSLNYTTLTSGSTCVVDALDIVMLVHELVFLVFVKTKLRKRLNNSDVNLSGQLCYRNTHPGILLIL